MDILKTIGILFAGFLLNFVWKADGGVAGKLAGLYLGLVLVCAVCTGVYYFAGIKQETGLSILQFGYKGTGMAGRLLFGYLLGWLMHGYNPAVARITLWGISVAIGFSFLLSTMGKATNMDDMISFFHQSGYAVWFLYFIMAVETAGALGILLHFKLRMGRWAAAGLMLIMLGAVYTHWHNHDPFSDSYSAVIQLISLSLLLWLYFLGKKGGRIVPMPG